MSGKGRSTSRALEGVAEPDFADVQIVPLRGATGIPADEWARAIFDRRSLPWWVKALFGVRMVLVPFIGLRQSEERAAGPFEVRDVVGDEALVVTDEPHLLFQLGVRADDEAGLLLATTVVQHHGWRGRLYFVPVGVLHGPVLRSMMVRAVARAGRGNLRGDEHV